ncbi:MAG: endonuclease/exonuclease/phosphatase family protein [Candidatus Riflebacteria bacterium]|nr:endonuclease/exonuclease/phosphatase family protein [Candidatus Riflebacteria bacterium]
MNEIRLVYALNIFSAKDGVLVQEFEIDVLVENLGFQKQIAVHWATDDNVWNILPAHYNFQATPSRERWLAKGTFRAHSQEGLSGNIRFKLRYLVEGKEYWDDNHQLNFYIKENAGILLGPGFLLSQICFRGLLPHGETAHPVAVAVNRSVQAGQVFIRWTIDNWQTFHQTRCFLQHDYWHQERQNRADNLQEDGVTLWVGRIKVRSHFKVEYVIGCETEQEEIWDNNFGGNYIACRAGLKILTLNLHCYQEADQDDKFNEIARAIHENDIDVVCLQEVGEEWNGGQGLWPSNAAKIIQERIQGYGRSYFLHTDWAHIGFDRYREGIAILSKHRFLKCDAGYVSPSHNIHDIHSRKVVMAQIHFPYVGLINVFSVHLSWMSGGFQQQYDKLQQWAHEIGTDQVAATFICGDFNNKAGSPGYMQIADSGFEDQFLRVTSPAIFAKVFRDSLPGREEHLASDGRIDFLFAKRGNRFQPTAARVLFSGQDYKRVSDHFGYLAEFVSE